jgi:hypothetical protein
MPPPTHEDDPDFEEAQEERRLLNLLKLRSFTVSPPTIRPFEKATLKWEVSVPAAAANVATFALGGAVVPAVGSRTVGPLATGAFVLEARGSLTKRVMGSRVVNVDQTGLQERQISARVIQDNAQGIKDLLRAGRLYVAGRRGGVHAPAGRAARRGAARGEHPQLLRRRHRPRPHDRARRRLPARRAAGAARPRCARSTWT